MITGNKGEWSETYVLIKLLADGKLHAADENLERINDVFYPIIKIIREELENKRDFILDGDVKVVNGVNNEVLTSVSVHVLIEKSLEFFDDLKNAKGRSFSLPDQEEFLRSIEINSIKARSQDKSDITLVVHDLKTGKKPTFGFSIKSLIGKNSTLFNPGTGTNFIYKITPNTPNFDFKEFNKRTFEDSNVSTISKISHRLNELNRLGANIEFHSIQSENLQLNLTLIDSNLPMILSYMLYYKYRFGINKLKDLIVKLREENPISFNLTAGHPFYEYKLKNFLVDNALGMTPESVWTGSYDATGGIIIVKNDGDILCYHIYNKNEFQNYLVNNTKLEQASTSEDHDNPGNASVLKTAKPYKFGWMYENEGELYIKLNLQIRFNN